MVFNDMKYLTITIFLILGIYKNGFVFGEETLHENLNEFSIDVYRELAKKQDNFVYSSYSLANILALLYVGARGDTQLELRTALKLSHPVEKIENGFKDFGILLNSSKEITIKTANKIYVVEGFSIQPDFPKKAVEFFDAEVENFAFKQPQKAKETINSWVEKKTNNKIKNIIAEDALTNLTRIILVNALYFNGNWEHPFKVGATAKAKFHNKPSESVDVDMMKLTANLEYDKDASMEASILRLPYVDPKAEMVIILPDKVDGLKNIEKNMKKLLENRNFTKAQVSLFLPKFKVESTINMIPILEQLKIQEIFYRPDLSGFTNEPIVVTTFIQKSFMDVNEMGTEAAFATAAVADNRAVLVDPAVTFKVDHPFIFALLYDGLEILSGRIEKF